MSLSIGAVLLGQRSVALAVVVVVGHLVAFQGQYAILLAFLNFSVENVDVVAVVSGYGGVVSAITIIITVALHVFMWLLSLCLFICMAVATARFNAKVRYFLVCAHRIAQEVRSLMRLRALLLVEACEVKAVIILVVALLSDVLVD